MKTKYVEIYAGNDIVSILEDIETQILMEFYGSSDEIKDDDEKPETFDQYTITINIEKNEHNA